MRLLCIADQIDSLECLTSVAKMCILNCAEVSVQHFIVFVVGLYSHKGYIF